MRKIIAPVILFVSLFWLGLSVAQAKEGPEKLLDRVTQEMIDSLKRHDAELKKDPELIYKIVNKIIVPYIDWPAMSGWVVGRQAWGSASESQRNDFIQEFKTLLIHTYASTLRAYNDQVVDYLPIRGGVQGKTRVVVSSLIKEPGRQPIRVTYRMADKGDTWKVYDISIEGVSLLKGFQSQFSNEIQQGGIEKLLQRLRKHNEKSN